MRSHIVGPAEVSYFANASAGADAPER